MAIPQAVLLDALGTLVELEPPAPALAREFRCRFGVELTVAEAQRAIRAEIDYYRRHLDEGRDEESLAGLRRRCARILGDNLPAHAAAAVRKRAEPQALTDVLLASLRFTVYADVRPALSQMRGRGLQLVVVSNWDCSLRHVLERLGVAALLDGVVTSAEVGARKPDPSIFERALHLVGVPTTRAIHVGDSIEEDVAGARRVGIEPVLIVRAGAPARRAVQAAPAGVRSIASLAEL